MWRFLGAVAILFLIALGVFYYIGYFDAPKLVGTPGESEEVGPRLTPDMKAHLESGTSPGSSAMQKDVAIPGKEPFTLRDAVITLMEDQEVASRFDGKIIEILVDLNQPVKRGQVLARLDDTTAHIKELAAQIKAETSNETIEAAKAKLETSEQIVKDDEKAGRSVSENDKLIHRFQRDQAKFEKLKAIGEREVAKQELQAAKTEREQHRIVSNVNGVIARSYKKLGEHARAGEPVFKVANYDRLRVEGAVPAQQAPYIKVGMRCLVEPERLLDPLGELRGHTAPITAITVTPDRRLMASASEDQSVILWYWSRGRRWDTLQDTTPLYAVAAGKPVKDEATGNTTYSFLTGGENGRARLWFVTANAQGQRVEKKSIEVSDPEAHRGGVVRAVAFSPDGKTFATGGDDRVLCVWKLDGDKPTFQYRVQESLAEPAHRGAVTTLNFFQDDKGDLYLVSAGTDRSLKRWKLDAKHALLDFRQKDRAGDVTQLGVSQDGQLCLFDAGDKLWMLDFNERDLVGTIDSGGRGHFATLALFTPSGHMVLTANANGRLQLFSTPVNPKAASFFRDAYAEGFRRNSLLALGLLSACASDETLLLAPGALASCLEQPKQAPPPEVSSGVLTLSPAAHVQFPMVLVNNREFRGLTTVPEIWPLQAYELRHLVTPDASAVTCAAFVPEPPGYQGETILFTGGTDKLIRIWKLPAAWERSNALEAIVTAVSNQVESRGLVRVRAEFDNPGIEGARLFSGSNVNLTIYPETAEKPQRGGIQ